MIISRTPFRISFFGGGTDLPKWFREHGGAVLSTTINRYCYISLRPLPPFFSHKSRVVWSRIEEVNTNDEIEHPAIRETLKYLNIEEGLDIHHVGDLPARTGLGSSSSFTVGLLQALHAFQGKTIDKTDLAKLSIFVEQNVLKEHVGVQDQIAVAHGGFNRIDIDPDGSFSVKPLADNNSRIKALQSKLMLFYTGVSRQSTAIEEDKISSLEQKQTELTRIREMVDESIAIFSNENADLNDFGRLLNEYWQNKKQLSDMVAPDFINDIYDKGIKSGAIGGKLLGAGGGGFVLFFVPEERQQDVKDALHELLWVPIEFEDYGSQIIFYDQETYSQRALKNRDFTQFSTNGC
jgi:D-glycero-alpha-D-manno-heptose-7-phosphate kinase